ncbi:MAG: ABC transporter permease [Vicinamibacterales bacterium]
MPGSDGRGLHGVLLLIDALGAIAPASERRAWVEQWRAELWHYALWLTREGRAPVAGTLLLLGRAAGAVPHALQLRALQWSPRMIFQDLKFAWRMFVRRPAFTAVAVLILALGIGANTTIFTWMQGLLFSPLAGVLRQDRLLVINGITATRDNLSMSYPNFVDLRAARPDGVADLAAFRLAPMNLRAGDEPLRVFGELVTANFFDLLGVRASLGRTFRSDEGLVPDGDPVAVIADSLWRRVFGADPAVIGRSVALNGRQFTIVGVTPPGFQGASAALRLEVFVPMSMQKAIMGVDRLALRGNSWMEVYARIADGAPAARVQASIAVAGRRLAEQYPDVNKGRGLRAAPLWRAGAGTLLLPVLGTLMAIVALVLLIACANVAGLLLARAAGRRREIAVRLAIGASRWQVMRQLLLENLLVAGAGCAGGLLVAHWASGALNAFVPPTPYPVAFAAGLDSRGVAFASAIAVVTAILSGLMPALRASRPDVGLTLKVAALTGTTGRGRLRQALVVAQVALSVVLLVCASLFARSLASAASMDPGFSARQGLLASIDLMPGGYDEVRGAAFLQQLLVRVAAEPHVAAASVARSVPLDLGSGSDTAVTMDGYTPRDGEDVTAFYNQVGPGYFETMGIPLVRGRGIVDRDVANRPRVAVINETMARRYWSGRDPIGATIRYGSGPVTVVGIARDGKYQRLNEEPRNYLYLPVLQNYRGDLVLHVRTDRDPRLVLPAVQAAVHALDPNLPLFDVRTLDDHLRIRTLIPRMAAAMLGVFGLLGLFLASIGLYGVIAFGAAERTREIGLRMALGAGRSQVVWLVLRDGLALAAVGISVGLALASAAGRLVAGQLTGVSGWDPLSFLAAALLLIAVAAAACLLPALRASALSPLTALQRD